MGNSVDELLKNQDKNKLVDKKVNSIFNSENIIEEKQEPKNQQLTIYRDKLIEILTDGYVKKHRNIFKSNASFGNKLFELLLLNELTGGKEGINFKNVQNKSFEFDEYIQESIWNNESFWSNQGNNSIREKYDDYYKLPISGTNGGKKIVANVLPVVKTGISDLTRKNRIKANQLGNMLLKYILMNDLYFVNEFLGLDTKGFEPNKNPEILEECDLYKYLQEQLSK